MRHKGLIITLIAVVLLGGSFLFGMMVYFLSRSGQTQTSFFDRSGVGVITVAGTILTSDETVRQANDFLEDDNVSAVILRIQSPGGSVAASQEILEAIRILAKKKPVIASMGSVAASGGYYVALGATEIFANAGTITGSIGVRLEHIMIGDLLKWAKVQHETLKSGQFKDMMPIDAPISPEARVILEAMLEQIHVQFKQAVSTARNIPMEDLETIADGRIVTGEEAQHLKLVDTLGGLSEAINRAGELAHIEGMPHLIYPKKRHPWIEHLFTEAKVLVREMAGVQASSVPQPTTSALR